jgi:hypothetical protein
LNNKIAGICQLDYARTMPEMLSEVFLRSCGVDYTLLLRLVGIDRINTELLIHNVAILTAH